MRSGQVWVISGCQATSDGITAASQSRYMYSLLRELCRILQGLLGNLKFYRPNISVYKSRRMEYHQQTRQTVPAAGASYYKELDLRVHEDEKMKYKKKPQQMGTTKMSCQDRRLLKSMGLSTRDSCAFIRYYYTHWEAASHSLGECLNPDGESDGAPLGDSMPLNTTRNFVP
ncbi:hypothetical protein P7K49_012723 [Saguinus oedipus]|uniref:Uncharacterized protein n=1 Tax=Saguinus oedipus TaxID=9490 RepID=A0ABQ9VFZ4_SAGOE|nr:hypothetical protein P7K49_012723 [Saguinus oedipus]